MKYKEQIRIILSECDFKTIHSVMTFLSWKWSYNGEEKKIPSVADLRSVSEYCLNQVANSDDKSAIYSAGGFEAEKIENTLELRFVLDRVNPLSHLLNPDAKNELARKT